jgi:hypothetical protein
MYASDWKGGYETCEPTTNKHHYENRVQASNSIFNFPLIDPKANRLFEYPGINVYTQECVLGDAGPTKGPGNKRFAHLNALLGAKCKVRAYVVVFKGRPMQDAMNQRTYWKGGNKNELVICIGTDDINETTWCYVFGWTTQETLKSSIQSYVIGQDALDIDKLGQWLYQEIDGKVIRRDFREFKYLTVYPPTWVIIMTYLLTLAVTIGICVWGVTNEFDNWSNFR